MIKSKIILDSVSEAGARLITYELTYPRFVHAEFMTHRSASKNAASCLTGDTLITIVMPNKKKIRSYEMRLDEIYRKWFIGDSKGRFMRDRIKNLNLRCLNEDTGELVTTKIINCFKQGVQKVYEIQLENGKFLKCTENHRIYTSDGWKTLKDFNISITNNNIVYYDKELPLIATNGFKLTREWILNQKSLGKTIKQICEEYNLNYKSVCGFNEKERIFFKRKQLINETFEFKDKIWLEQKLKEGLFSTDIAKICKTTHFRVKKQMKKFNLKGNRWTWKNKTTWNKGKTYKLPEESLVNVRAAAKKRIKPDSHKLYKDFNIAITRFLTENRKDILNKFNYKCQLSGTNQYLQLHHIVPVWYDKTKAFDIDNIIPITKTLHKSIHSNNLDLVFMDYYYSDQDLSLFIEKHKDLKLKCDEILKPKAPGFSLVVRYSKISKITYIGEEETYDLEVSGLYKNFVANKIIVHNSRAVPVEKMIQKVIDNPAEILWWGKNQSGMQAKEQIVNPELKLAKKAWNSAYKAAIKFAKLLASFNLHKQITNRILEPFMNITVICTATDWNNYFALRCHEDAQPEIRRLAFCMLRDYYNSSPKLLKIGEWHTPYLTEEESNLSVELRKKISVAKAARVSYFTHDGKRDYNKDLELYTTLYDSGHMSPFEHVATPSEDPNQYSGNFRGWIQYRKTIPNEIKTIIPTLEEVNEYFSAL